MRLVHFHGRMSAVKTVVTLLAMTLLGSQAAPPGPDCDGLNKTLSREDLHKLNGHWVLVWSVAHGANSAGLLTNLSSSHLVLTLLPDNTTLFYYEKNVQGDVCTTYSTNLTLSSHGNGYKFSTNHALIDKNGKVEVENITEEVTFLESCPDCVSLLFTGEESGEALFIYRREGHHRDPEQVKTFHSDYDKLAECLNVPQSHKFIYDGVADFCHKKSSPENSN